VKCNITYTVVCTDSNVVMAFGTRYGIPEFNFSEVPPTPRTPSTFSQFGNNTAAFTNFLTSVYKSESMVDPTELLGLYASSDLVDKGIYLKLIDVFPLQHSILVWVDTTTPLKASN
jgi:NIMA (never in mitosis gene a)-related kinase 8